ncbi:MAG: hypothetical protein IJ007_01555 [Oscillospiraceae bacterium]|nr:hypothetical protein [Oscillospiraceae bacterium]
MSKIKAVILLSLSIFLAGCAEKEIPEETTVVTTTVTEPESDHSLLRPFTINEAFSEVKASGKVFCFPIPLTELEEGGIFSDCSYADNKLAFPDGTFAQAYANDSSIFHAEFELGSAPSDFSVIGIKLGDDYSVIYQTGIPDITEGDSQNGMVEYHGAGIQCIRIEFTNGKINKITMFQ